MQNFDRGNFDVFYAFQGDHQNFTYQIFKALQPYRPMVTIYKNIFHQMFGKSVSVKIPPVKIVSLSELSVKS